jgi:hypothetical protein
LSRALLATTTDLDVDELHYPLWGFASPTVRARRVAAWIKEMLIQTATLK